MEAGQSLISRDVTLKVSSVLNRDHKQFGKDKMIDGSTYTCWNSHQGSPQWVIISWPEPVDIKELQIMFQGGFAGKNCEVYAKKQQQGGEDDEGEGSSSADWEKVCQFYPQDINTLQFACAVDNTEQLKIVFQESTDFYGRITIYKLDVTGTLVKS